MSLENGILGYLSMKPMSGYDIKKLFSMSAAFFWPADQAQIYRTLKKLESSNLIEISGVEQNAGPSKTLYAITDKGRKDLREWVLSPKVSDFIVRQPFLIQLFLCGVLSREEQLEFIDTQLKLEYVLLDQLHENYSQNKNAFAETSGLKKHDPRFKSAVWTYRWGVLSTEAYIMFLKDIKADILADADE